MDNFEKIDKLGEGAFGKVFKVKQKSDETFFAMKEITGPMDRSIAEYETMQTLYQNEKCGENKYIVKPETSFQIDDRYYIIMEYLDGGDLERYLLVNKNERINKYAIMTQLIEAIKYIHCSDLIHGDLKFNNVLMKENQIKISDFGISCFKPKCNYAGGTRTFMDPILYLTEGAKLSKECDIYSLGVIFYEMLEGKEYYPKVYMNEHEILQNFESKMKYKTDPIHSLIFNMLQPFAQERRFTIDEIHSMILIDGIQGITLDAMEKTMAKRKESLIAKQVIPPTLTRAENRQRIMPFIKAEYKDLKGIMSEVDDQDVLEGVRATCGKMPDMTEIIKSAIRQYKAEEASVSSTGGRKPTPKIVKKRLQNL